MTGMICSRAQPSLFETDAHRSADVYQRVVYNYNHKLLSTHQQYLVAGTSDVTHICSGNISAWHLKDDPSFLEWAWWKQ